MTVDETLSVRINGEQRRVPSGISIAALIAELGLDAKRVAVERNLDDRPALDVRRGRRSRMATDYEIVHFVGGG